jgi:hypothetical protein
MKKFDRSLSQKLLLVTIAVLSVAGCASKSSSSDSSSVTAFSQWSAVTGGSTIIATGFSAQRTYVTDSSGNYQLVGNASQSTSNNATYTSQYDNAGSTYNIYLKASSGYSLAFDKGVGDSLTNSSVLVGSYVQATNVAGTNSGLFANGPANGWDYQSFGVWVTGQGLGAGTVGAATYGNPLTSLPTTGTATFTGLSSAVAITGTNSAGFATANMSASVDYGAQTVVISTSNTTLTNSLIAKNITSTTSAPQLNYSGLLVFSGSGTLFNGNITTTGGMTGTAQGQLYGPNAQEIGGTFSASGSGVTSLIGAFGGKR